MKKKIKYIAILTCTLVAIIGSSISVYANSYLYTFSYVDKENNVYEYFVETLKDNIALVKHSEAPDCYSLCYYENGVVYRYEHGVDSTNISWNVFYLYDFERENVYAFMGTPSVPTKGIKGGSEQGISFFNSEQAYIDYYAPIEEPSTEEPPTVEPPTEEPPTEEPPTEEPPTEEPPTEEPPTEEPPMSEPSTGDIDYGIAGNLVSDLIGNCKEFTPQSVMAIFVICLVLECLSHIASALLSVGGMK